MRSKPYLRNSARAALLFSLFACLSLTACQKPIEPTYKEKDLPSLVKQICKNEYNLEVVTARTLTTLWVYAPLSKILHQDYGKQEDKVFDEEIADRLRNILTTIGRVLVSSDRTPEFFALVASDINLGLDYIILANVLDIKKSYAGYIPYTEMQRRYVIKFNLAPDAIQDTTGTHVRAYDVKLADFLAQQIAQRIAIYFQGENLKKYFKVNKSEGVFNNGRFVFAYSIQEVLKPQENINVIKEVLNTFTYCIKTYEFRDFSALEINDLITRDRLVLSRQEVWARPMPMY